jgi:hypothetical protein
VDDVNVGGRIASAPPPAPGVLDGVEASVTCCDRLPLGFCAVKNSGSVKGGVSNQLFWIFRADAMSNQRHRRAQPRQYFVHQ